MATILKVKIYEFFLFENEAKVDVLYKKLLENIKKTSIKNDPDKLMMPFQVSENLSNQEYNI